MIDLAFDLEEIRTEHLDSQKWNAKKALDRLRNKEPYRTKYPPTSSATPRWAVGEDRIQEIEKWIGPMDDDAIERLAAKTGSAFNEALTRRLGDSQPNLADVKRLLKWASDLHEKMSNMDIAKGG
jgi:hypothetical protein